MFFIAGLALLLTSCIDPVPPEFEYKEGLVFIEGVASTLEGASFVSISASAIEYNVKVVNDVHGAEVAFLQPASGVRIELEEQPGGYVPPMDFAVKPGESWFVDIVLEDGTHYRSEVEKVLPPVAITGISAAYDPELYFRDASQKYVPGHRVFLSFEDPGVDTNYYYWTYRAFENLDICDICQNGIFREGKCIMPAPGTSVDPYYYYQCDSECWKIRYPEKISVLDDSFINGKQVSGQEVAEIPLYTKENMAVEIQQFSLSQNAYHYYKVLSDLVDNNGSLNAPPPAALIGNLYNVVNDNEYVFGRFTTASSSSASVFIERSGIEEQAIDKYEISNYEGCEVCPPGTSCPVRCGPVTITPCSETRYRTSLVPKEWKVI
jgi:hypothetical protein